MMAFRKVVLQLYAKVTPIANAKNFNNLHTCSNPTVIIVIITVIITVLYIRQPLPGLRSLQQGNGKTSIPI